MTNEQRLSKYTVSQLRKLAAVCGKNHGERNKRQLIELICTLAGESVEGAGFDPAHHGAERTVAI